MTTQTESRTMTIKPTKRNVPAILDAAADRLEQGRWCRNTLTDNRGGCCAYGAIYEVVGIPTTLDADGYVTTTKVTPWQSLDGIENALDYIGIPDLAEYNDNVRDKRKVIRKLRKAAAAWRMANA